MILQGVHYKKNPWKWKRKYKYALIEDVQVYCGILGIAICTPWFKLSLDGFLTIKKGYQWDGCTGMVDTENNMLGGVAHDCLYQMLREALIPNYSSSVFGDFKACMKQFVKMRLLVDELFENLLEANQSWKITRVISFKIIRLMGRKHSLPKFLKNRG